MRAISAVFLCMGLVACDSGDSNSSSGKDGSTQEDGAVVVGDAGGGSLDATLEVDAAVSDVDAAEIDAAVGEDAEVADAALDGEVADTSVPDTSVPDTAVPLTADQMLEAQVTAKMRECAVLTATGNFRGNKVVDAFDRCLSHCYIAADCSNLDKVLCTGGTIAPAVLGCVKGCFDAPTPDGFHCASGDQIIPHNFVCDGVRANCTGNTCEDFGCVDESDEASCTETFTCDGGKHLLIKYVCDGYTSPVDECADMTDESGCAEMCPGS